MNWCSLEIVENSVFQDYNSIILDNLIHKD